MRVTARTSKGKDEPPTDDLPFNPRIVVKQGLICVWFIFAIA